MKPKIAFVSLWNAAQPNTESGYAYSMRRQLQQRFDVIDLFPLELPGECFWLPLRAAYRLTGRYYHPMREPAVLKRLSRRIEYALSAIKPDLVFSPSSVPMSFVESRCNWIYATDQLFCDFVETYIRRPSARFRRLGEAQEARALASAARTSYPSEWAADSAVRRYGGDRSKIIVIPWGANLPEEIPQPAVEDAIGGRKPDQCRLVFIGRDWLRKGGDRLVATVAELNNMGLNARATIIGCEPLGLAPDRFTIHPFLDKGNRAQLALFASILLGAHFVMIPARAEAYGQAFCEAFAYGVPAIGCAVGGVPTIIRDGENGFLMAPAAEPADIAQRIYATLSAPERYRRMARQAREDYRQRLNWNHFGSRLSETIYSLV